MDAESDSDTETLKKLFKILDYNGYYSVLMVYHSEIPDYLIKCANVIDKTLSIKYMPAIRTYAISPEYFSMIYDAFEQIQEDRIMFNIVSGDLKDTEKSLDNLVGVGDFLKTYDQRVAYTNLWLKKLKNVRKGNKMPEMVLSGTSSLTLQSAEEYGDYSLCMLDYYIKNIGKFNNIKNKMVAVMIVLRDSIDEAKQFIERLPEHQLEYTIFGTQSDVINRIKYLNSCGITDIMIRCHPEDEEKDRIHSMIKSITGGLNASI
jgi:alkanesulfonate monooxygenase SsuD/methylene tetrahydromethanopterin reductase-like flavin-dependent oxidoreductase (luciferase family)